jgi:hypothetical protein
MARSFPDALLAELRSLPLAKALGALDYHVSVDRSFEPVKDARSERWIVSGERGVTELIVTGPKWLDTRSGKGGGGAIDLVVHIEALSFVAAVKRLEAARGRYM